MVICCGKSNRFDPFCSFKLECPGFMFGKCRPARHHTRRNKRCQDVSFEGPALPGSSASTSEPASKAGFLQRRACHGPRQGTPEELDRPRSTGGQALFLHLVAGRGRLWRSVASSESSGPSEGSARAYAVCPKLRDLEIRCLVLGRASEQVRTPASIRLRPDPVDCGRWPRSDRLSLEKGPYGSRSP